MARCRYRPDNRRDPVRKVRIDETWIAMDPGTLVNQERVHSQLEGSIVMGISNAMYGGLMMTNGATDQTNFRDAPIARVGDVPRRIHTEIVASNGPPCGVGEPGSRRWDPRSRTRSSRSRSSAFASSRSHAR